MGGGNRKKGNFILSCGSGFLDSLPPPALKTVVLQRHAAEIVIPAQHHHDIPFGDEVLRGDILHGIENLRSPGIRKGPPNLPKLIFDNPVKYCGIPEDAAIELDILKKLLHLLFQLIPLQPGKPLKAHIQNGLSLKL